MCGEMAECCPQQIRVGACWSGLHPIVDGEWSFGKNAHNSGAVSRHSNLQTCQNLSPVNESVMMKMINMSVYAVMLSNFLNRGVRIRKILTVLQYLSLSNIINYFHIFLLNFSVTASYSYFPWCRMLYVKCR